MNEFYFVYSDKSFSATDHARTEKNFKDWEPLIFNHKHN